VVGILLAGLMTLSRLYLFVHFPSDILAGIILGVLIGSVVSYFCYKKEKNIKY
jgi:undecaprenyl-diphosphatase